MFKENFIRLCTQKGVSPSAACKSVGITPATFSCWTDTSIPRKATLLKLADYFGVSVEVLTSDAAEPPTDKNTITVRKRDGQRKEREITDEQATMFFAMIDALPEVPQE